MAKNDTSPQKEDRGFNKGLQNVSRVLNQLSTSLYGADMTDDTESLNDRFNSIMQSEINKITHNGENTFDSFLGRLYSSDKDDSRAALDIIATSQLQLGSSAGLNPQDFITEQYKNQMLKQADANQISNQLIELREAKEIMRDAILSADVNTGRINRQITFEKTTVSDAEEDYGSLIAAMEKKFDTPKLIKDFIVDNTLGYGSYYTYTIPYAEVFNNFAKRYNSSDRRKYGRTRFFESGDNSVEDITIRPIFESGEAEQQSQNSKGKQKSADQIFLESAIESVSSTLDVKTEDVNVKKSIESDLRELFSDRITVCTSHVPIPILEDGLEAYQELAKDYWTEDGLLITEDGQSKKSKKTGNNKDGEKMLTDEDSFVRKYSEKGEDDGFYRDEKKEKSEEFTEADIKDCYIKMIPPTRMFPIKIMGQKLFYLYIQTDDATPLSTILSYTSQLKVKDPSNRINNLVDDIAERIVSKFDKSFVKDNIEFRKLIVSALEYYDMSNTKIHFQLIPKQYITEFKINTDIDGNGHSMLEPSLFYAKLYLMLLMFNIMTILTKGNDEKINYIRTSGIDKNTFNKAQEIIRQKQGRRITINDMFSYTSVINKVGSGMEIFMPLGKNGERPVETDILQGQDVQLHSELMEWLRTAYILGTNVPSAIMNYLNEADFAKSIETANTKMNGRVINYQIDLNDSLSEWYQKLLRYSTDMPEEVISSVRCTLPEPKGSANVATQEILNNYQTLQEFLIRLYIPDDADETKKQLFIKELAKLHLPMINFAQIEKCLKDVELASAKNEITKPADVDDISAL